jgi:hypothetical protein
MASFKQVTMKNLLRLLALVAVCSSLAIAATTPAAPAVDKSKFKTGGCCDKAEKGGNPCAHPCCVKAAKDAPAPAKDAPVTK